ncbi:MAG: 7-cyano-7-deazaguanine synthase [Thermosipho sp. (in: Bacteria)]|nr:7-cyano-7-deazaguanine synthase [Thermosipho sp. (in: thermotogales)]
MKEKVIVLNSGGFDSVVLIKWLAQQKYDIVSIFFDYEQRNVKQEREKARKVAKEVKAEHIEIKLPKFEWSNNSLYDKSLGIDIKNQYIHMRNLIFLSYAISVAESKKINKIYSAIINARENTYSDTSIKFINAFNDFVNKFGIEFKTPFSELSKVHLGYIARVLDIKKNDFFSCNTPKDNGEPCGKCGDCKSLDYIVTNILEDSIPIHTYFRANLNPDEKFKKLFRNSKIKELRLLNTDKCQFNCKHCFYGFDKMKGNQLTIEEYKNIIDQANELGIENIHFSGREPLCDENIFEIMAYIKQNYSDMTYDLVTNGVYIERYIDRLKELEVNKIFVSIDNLKDLKIRPTIKGVIDAIDLIQNKEIPLEVFIDIHKGNKNQIKDIIYKLYKEYNVRNFHVRPISPLGRGKNIINEIIDAKELDEVFKDLINLNLDNVIIEFAIKNVWTKKLLERNYTLSNYLYDLIDTTNNIVGNIVLLPEFYCSRFESQITLTPDGYILGCATEISSIHYDKISVGNIRELPLKKLIKLGKEQSLKMIDKQHKNKNYNGSCYHTFYKLKN